MLALHVPSQSPIPVVISPRASDQVKQTQHSKCHTCSHSRHGFERYFCLRVWCLDFTTFEVIFTHFNSSFVLRFTLLECLFLSLLEHLHFPCANPVQHGKIMSSNPSQKVIYDRPDNACVCFIFGFCVNWSIYCSNRPSLFMCVIASECLVDFLICLIGLFK